LVLKANPADSQKKNSRLKLKTCSQFCDRTTISENPANIVS
jgi:hypothetical protein